MTRDRKEYMREWREKKQLEDPDYFRRTSIEHYHKRKETLTEEEKIAKRERSRSYQKQRRILDIRVSMLNEAKKRAKKKELPFDLTKEDIVIPEFCPVLGIPLVVGVGKQSPNSPSLDRKINELGYVVGNVEVISLKANTLKSDATIEELKAVVKYMEGFNGILRN